MSDGNAGEQQPGRCQRAFKKVCPRLGSKEWRETCCLGLKFTLLKLLLLAAALAAFTCAAAYYSLYAMALFDPGAVLDQAESSIRDKLPTIITGSGPADATQDGHLVALQARERDSRSRNLLYVLAQVFISLVALFSFLYFVRVLNYKEGQTFVVINSAILFAVAVAATVVSIQSGSPVASHASTWPGNLGPLLAPVSTTPSDSTDPFATSDSSGVPATQVETSAAPSHADSQPETTVSTKTTTTAPSEPTTWIATFTEYVMSIGLFWWTFVLLALSLSTLRD